MAEIKDEVKDIETKETKTDQKTVEASSPAPKKRKRVKRSVPAGQVHIMSSFNNTIVSFTDNKGNVIASSSAGANGFRGSKKGTAYAAQVASDSACQTAKNQYGLSKAEVFVRGIGLGRDSAIRALANHNIEVESLTDITGIPHGGVRPKKARRV